MVYSNKKFQKMDYSVIYFGQILSKVKMVLFLININSTIIETVPIFLVLKLSQNF